MREPERLRQRAPEATLRIRDLNVHYGRSHVLQGVGLTLERGILSIVGRNGMGKSTLCKTIMGLVKSDRGTISFEGRELRGLTPSQIANLGVGYVPQGRRLWRSLTVDEHLRLSVRRGERVAWTPERIYDTFPRLAERRNNGGAQLSGGEQQMLAISRALLLNPRLLVMDEPTEGLAPVIVTQVEEMLLALGDEEDIAVLVIEQNIGVATAVSENVAIMVNGRINRVMGSAELSADRELQQRLLGVGRHGHEDVPDAPEDAPPADEAAAPQRRRRRPGMPPRKGGDLQPAVYRANPTVPTRWSPDATLAEILAASGVPLAEPEVESAEETRPGPGGRREPDSGVVLVVGTLDTKAAELRYLRECLHKRGVRTRLVDLSTSGKPSGADVPPHQVAAYHRRGPNGVFTGDRGQAIGEMATAFENWIVRQRGISGIISAGGSGGTSLATPGMRRLPVGLPKLMVSTVASGNVAPYVGGSDIMMLYSVTDVQGLNRISREVLANAANAMAGMVAKGEAGAPVVDSRPSVGLTMFGVTTPCVQRLQAALEDRFECLVFHATGTGGQSMESLIDSGMLTGALDVTTTEVCDLLIGGILPAHEDRFGSVARTRIPYIGSCGALDMVNFGALNTVPAEFRGRNLYQHNPQVTLMRTTPEENGRIGRWIGERLNAMQGPVRFFLPTGGVSALDAPGKPFHDPDADAALFAAIEATVKPTAKRQVTRLPHNINDPQFADAVAAAFGAMTGIRAPRRRTAR